MRAFKCKLVFASAIFSGVLLCAGCAGTSGGVAVAGSDHDHAYAGHAEYDNGGPGDAGDVTVIEREPPVVYEQAPAPVVVIHEAPPARPPTYVRVERTASPGPDYFWIDGYYMHQGSRFVWVKGRWERHRPGHTYVSAQWARNSQGGWELRGGYWQRR